MGQRLPQHEFLVFIDSQLHVNSFLSSKTHVQYHVVWKVAEHLMMCSEISKSGW